jgi:hypothetical protein
LLKHPLLNKRLFQPTRIPDDSSTVGWLDKASPQLNKTKSIISFFCVFVEGVLMEESRLIIAIAVGIISTRKKKQAIQDNALLPLGTTLVVLGIIFGDDHLVAYSFI